MSQLKIQNYPVEVDEKTGLPADYNSFIVAYRPLIMSIAESVGIAPQDREDAVNEVQLKFWKKNGLDMFDPNRGQVFATLLRSWASLFMLQERDKSIKQKRYEPNPPEVFNVHGEMFFESVEQPHEQTYVHDAYVLRWLRDAENALEAAEKIALVPVLQLCVRAAAADSGPSRAQVAELYGCSIGRATGVLRELRETLDNLGFGMESLYEHR